MSYSSVGAIRQRYYGLKHKALTYSAICVVYNFSCVRFQKAAVI